MKRRWIFCSIAAVQFPARSEAVIDPKMLRFSVCQAGVQRKRSLTAHKRVGLERPVSGVVLPFQRAKFDSGGRPCPAISRRSPPTAVTQPNQLLFPLSRRRSSRRSLGSRLRPMASEARLVQADSALATKARSRHVEFGSAQTATAFGTTLVSYGDSIHDRSVLRRLQ
jgi:hypothetical protein